jgi:hypothetical protein
MGSIVFKIGMMFANIEEVRQAVNAYNIRDRVKIKKIEIIRQNYMLYVKLIVGFLRKDMTIGIMP